MSLSVSQRRMRLFMTLLSLSVLVGCGARPSPPSDDRPVIEMEPMIVEVTGEGDDQTVRAFDAQSLFRQGRSHIESEEHQDCVDSFGELLERFPQSRFAHAAIYNRGLCYEDLRQHAMASAHFRRYTDLAKGEKDRRDGQFRWGYNMVESGRYTEALRLYEVLLKLNDIGLFDRAECHLRQGIAKLRLNRFSEAERDFKTALTFVEKATEGTVEGNDLAAESHFRRGEVYFELNRNVSLKLPLKRMKSDLDAKTRFFRQAQASFIDTLNVRNPYWATAAGLQLGSLYEEFYRDILKAEFPDDFDADMREVYFLELKKHLQPLLEQSVAIYERSITMSMRLQTSNRWVKETELRLNKLRTLIEENAKAIKAFDEALEADQAEPKEKPQSPRNRSRGRAKPAEI